MPETRQIAGRGRAFASLLGETLLPSTEWPSLTPKNFSILAGFAPPTEVRISFLNNRNTEDSTYNFYPILWEQY